MSRIHGAPLAAGVGTFALALVVDSVGTFIYCVGWLVPLVVGLFGLGGVLMRYRPEGDLMTIAFACAVSLIVHPLITFSLSNALDLSQAQMRSAVVTAAMAPGVNAYIFADMYGSAKRVAASTVLVGTALTVLTAWGWLTLLG